MSLPRCFVGWSALCDFAFPCHTHLLFHIKQFQIIMGRAARKPVFGVSDKARLKPASLAIHTSKNIETCSVANLHMILSKE